MSAISFHAGPRGVRLTALACMLSLGFIPSWAAAVEANALLVIDPEAGLNLQGALFQIDPALGSRTLLSDFGDPVQGPTGDNPSGVALTEDGEVLVVNADAGLNLQGALFTLDSTTNARTLLSDFGDPAQGPIGIDPSGVTMAADGQILVLDRNAGTNLQGALFRVNPTTGGRTLVSDFGDPNPILGPTGIDPSGIAIALDGGILVVDENAGPSLQGALFRVDPVTGIRTLLSDFGNLAQGPVGIDPSGVAVATNGQLLVVDREAGVNLQGALFRVDPITGIRTLVSDFGDPNPILGPTGIDPSGVAIAADSGILVADRNAGLNLQGALFRVDPVTGTRTLLSDFGNLAQGPVGIDPNGTAAAAAIPAAAPCNNVLPSASCLVNGVPGLCRGTPGPDVIQGGPQSDVILAFDGNDQIFGAEGNDLICSGEGDDVIAAGPGDDLIRSGAGNDQVSGEDGNDLLRGGAGNDGLFGNAGDDTLKGGGGDDTLDGADGIDIIRGGEGIDTCIAGENVQLCEL